MALSMHAMPERAGMRLRLWQGLACVLAILTLIIAWHPPVLRWWTSADILLIVLLLASEWLVLIRIYRREGLTARQGGRRVKALWSALLVSALVLLVLSHTR
jgi:hypothetical protein